MSDVNRYCAWTKFAIKFSAVKCVFSADRDGLRDYGLRSSSSSTMYSPPRLHIKFGEREFSYSDPSTSNALPDNIRSVTDPAVFRKLLKSQYLPRCIVCNAVFHMSVCPSVKRVYCDKMKAPSEKSSIMTNRKSPTSFPMSLN